LAGSLRSLTDSTQRRFPVILFWQSRAFSGNYISDLKYAFHFDQINSCGDGLAALGILFGAIIHDPHHPQSLIPEDAHRALNGKARRDDPDAVDGNFAYIAAGQRLREYSTRGDLIIRSPKSP
jgi:hypothetical protein